MRSKSLLWSFNFAIEGIVHALRTQRNMRIHVVVAVLVMIAGVVLRVSRVEFIILLAAIATVFGTELLNTAIEAAVDLATEGLDPAAKIAKDAAAGAVLVAAAGSVAIGYFVFFGRVRGLLENGFGSIRSGPAHITVLGLALTLAAVIGLKAVRHERVFVRGGWPSGHTALAFASATAIGLGTGSANAFVLAAAIAFLVAQSRVEGGAHNVPQVIAGGVVGCAVMVALFQLLG